MISQGSLPRMDTMRYVPLGFDTTMELQMVPYMIVLTYHLINLFGNYSVNFAGAFMPVIFFALTIVAFFLFVREIFVRKDDKESKIKANIIASISTLFMIVLPGFLSRTVAGIPEKESVGFFFMFLAFYLFVKAWKSEKLQNALILGVLSGISTALMGLAWGGVVYIYTTMGIAALIAILLNKFGKKETLIYIAWLVVSLLITLTFTNRFSLKGYVTSLDTGLVVVALIILGVHSIVWKTRVNEKLKLNKINLPKPVISLLVSIILIIILVSIVLGPGFIIEKLSALNQMLIQPEIGRWNTTVAENKQPYFTEWLGNFGKFVFWAFIVGSILLFKKMLKGIEKRRAYILTGFYILFLFGLIFSRYSPSSVLNGEGFLSKLLYYGSFFVFVCAAGYYT
jgi:asparagine N-glycosylation enzyme membrane subunit Stt3